MGLEGLRGEHLVLPRLGVLGGGVAGLAVVPVRGAGRAAGFDGRDDDLLQLLEGVTQVSTFQDVLSRRKWRFVFFCRPPATGITLQIQRGFEMERLPVSDTFSKDLRTL